MIRAFVLLLAVFAAPVVAAVALPTAAFAQTQAAKISAPVSAPITIGTRAWVCADVFVGPGVSIGEGTVVGARSSVFRNLPAWCVAAGSPAKAIRERKPPVA